MNRFKISKRGLLVMIAVAELALIAALGWRIVNGTSRTLGAVSVNPLLASALIFSKDGELKYFFEPKPFADDQSGNWRQVTDVEPKYSINADSLNERFDYSVPKPSGVFRIVTLGDSATFGHYVDTKHNYSEVLEDILQQKLQREHCPNVTKFEVINLGVPGYDIRYEAERFKVRGKKYSPDLVIWQLHGGDFTDPNELTRPLVTSYVGNGPISTEEDFHAQTKAWLRARREVASSIGEEGLKSYAATSLRTISDYYSGSLLVFGMPTGAWEIGSQYMPTLLDFVKSRPKTRYYSLDFDFGSGLFPFPDNHPNRQGHLEIASHLFSYLAENNMISCVK